MERLAVLAGLAVRRAQALHNPFLDDRFSIAAVSMAYALAEDEPLATDVSRQELDPNAGRRLLARCAPPRLRARTRGSMLQARALWSRRHFVALNACRNGFGYTLRHHLWEARLR
jgi:hypothetical protein